MHATLQKLLFALDAERAHGMALGGLDALARLGLVRWAPAVTMAEGVEIMGLRFPNRVGLAAGLDKNGDHLAGLGRLGFGFVEVGTVTPRPQPGNPLPRLFRLPEHRAVINRMGFNNKGVDHLVARLRPRRYAGVVGVNIGKNRDTPLERAADDYRFCLERVYPHADYVVVNISSPNTPGLRDLQGGEALADLLRTLKADQGRLRDAHGRHVPLVVKIAPDLDGADIDAIAAAVLEHGVDGVCATNTTLERRSVAGSRHADEAGGLSGAPLFDRATAVAGQLRRRLGSEVPIIGVGGVLSGADAARKHAAGADLVQVYTGLIYRGPALVSEMRRALAAAAPGGRGAPESPIPRP